MPKNSSRKRTPEKKKPIDISQHSRLRAVRSRLISQAHAYRNRRPHRSFRVTRRRDYVRSLDVPGYWAFTLYVFRVFKQHKKLFISLVLFYAVLAAAFVGLASQDTYAQLSTLLDTTSDGIFSGGWGAIGQAGLLVVSGLSGGLSSELTEAQQIYSVIILLLTWLTTVWMLRAVLAGSKPKLRDGLYSAGAPIVATAVVAFILILQLIPATLSVVVMNAAIGTNLFESGILAMLTSIAVALLVIVSLYFVTSSLIAMVVVTLPGMYPWQAIRTAGDLVVGRRVRILLRLGWSLLGSLLIWFFLVLIAVLIDRWVKSIFPALTWIPFVPVIISLATALITVWTAGYVYLLYRKVVEDDAAPA